MKDHWKFRSILLSLLSLRSLLTGEEAGLESLSPPDDVDGFGDKQIASATAGWSLFSNPEDEKSFTINFSNVSIKEYIRFISKISGTNFIYNEADLGFTVTIVSEEPMTLKSILSALVQSLRSNGLNLVEQNGSMMITRAAGIGEVSVLDIKGKGVKGKQPALVTRFLRVKNANLASTATIIKPLISQAALLEAVPEKRLFILTDTASNVEKVAELIEGLDSAVSPLEIEVYKARHLPPGVLIDLTKQIIAPFSEGNPLIFVPQNDLSSLFIVSTPALVERTLEIMEDLDRSPKSLSSVQLARDQVFLYKIESKSHSDLLEAIKQVSKELKQSGAHSIRLIDALENVQWVRSCNALLFITDTETQARVLELLKTLDTLSGSSNFYIYRILEAGQEQIERSLKELSKSLKKSGADLDLVETIHEMRYIRETHSLIFTGSDEALKKLSTILPVFDTALSQFSPTSHYWLYTPQYLSGKELEKSLDDLQRNLHSSGLSDQPLLQTIASMKWIPATNTLLFTGAPPSLTQVEAMIKLIDVPSGSPSKIFLYQPKNISNEQVEEALDELADKLDHKNLSDRNLASAIDQLTWIAETQCFLFKADPATIDKIQGFLKDIDNPSEAKAVGQTYFLYNLKYARGEDALSHLESIAKNLPLKDTTQKAIVAVIDSVSLLKQTNSLLITGPQKPVEDVKAMVAQFDQPHTAPPFLEKTAFFIYKPTHLNPQQLKAALEETADDLKEAGLVDPILLDSIRTMRVVDATGTLVFTGSAESLQKTKEILGFVDVATTQTAGLGEMAGHTFFLYRARFLTPEQLLTLLTNLAIELDKQSPTTNRGLLDTVKAAKEIKETRSLLFTGSSSALQKISELLTQLDSSGEGGIGGSNYLVYRPQHINGPELIEMLREFKQNLTVSGVRDSGLFNTIDNLKFIDKTGYILLSGDPASVGKAVELLKKFDMGGHGTNQATLSHLETSFLVYKLQYHSGAELQTTLKQIGQDLVASDPGINKNLIHAINSIQWIKMTNSLLATGTPDVLTRIKELINSVDVPLRQVFIEVLIIETTLTNNQQFGLQWGGKVQYLNRFAGGTGNFPSPNPANTGTAPNQVMAAPLAALNAMTTPTASNVPVPATTAGGFDLGVIGDIILHKGKSFISLASLVNALQTDNDSVVVMNPKIIAQDNQQSTIFVGQNIPFAGSSVNTLVTTGQQTATNIEYRDVGVNLTITPILGANDIITLDVSNDITAQVENTTNSVAGINGLQTSHTSLNARIHVPNNHFVALSGMLIDTKTHFKSSIPCLGGLPVIGAIFSENDRLDSKNNIIFFIRPSIIDSVEEFKKITEHQEILYKNQAIKQILKEEIDEGIDWVKTDDDE